MSDVPGTDAARLFEIRREEIVDDGLVFGRQQWRGGRASRIVYGPRRCGPAVSGEQKREQQQPDRRGGGRPFFAHFHRCLYAKMSVGSRAHRDCFSRDYNAYYFG